MGGAGIGLLLVVGVLFTLINKSGKGLQGLFELPEKEPSSCCGCGCCVAVILLVLGLAGGAGFMYRDKVKDLYSTVTGTKGGGVEVESADNAKASAEVEAAEPAENNDTQKAAQDPQAQAQDPQPQAQDKTPQTGMSFKAKLMIGLCLGLFLILTLVGVGLFLKKSKSEDDKIDDDEVPADDRDIEEGFA